MISLDQPSMALNDERHTHMTVNMWNTWKVRSGNPSQHIIDWVATVARGATGGKLKNVVFSCHGSPASVQMGQGFTRANVGLFSGWAGLVETIWFRACEVALIKGGGTAGDGNLFCSEVAKNAQCYVIASTEIQWTVPSLGDIFFNSGHHSLPYGKLDSFEGLLLCYGPKGNVAWTYRYGSGWWANLE